MGIHGYGLSDIHFVYVCAQLLGDMNTSSLVFPILWRIFQHSLYKMFLCEFIVLWAIATFR